MSFLHVVMPVETIDGLLDSVREQVASGRLEADPDFVGNGTRELRRLVATLQMELQVR
jgi:hypothetical protein